MPIYEGNVPEVIQPPLRSLKESVCLSHMLYHEARGELPEVLKAVLEVTENRMRYYKRSACQVVSAYKQYSWFYNNYLFVKDKYMLTLLKNTDKLAPTLNDLSYMWFYSGKKPKWSYQMKCREIGHMNFCKQQEK